MQKDEGWKSVCATAYILICLFDFIAIPAWFGVSRTVFENDKFLRDSEIVLQMEPAVQMKLIDAATFQHEPLTLKGGGLFHLAFGALLTGSALSGNRNRT